jgi:light-regulated signal transduction histidine kinase (bacteriophytochrome)
VLAAGVSVAELLFHPLQDSAPGYAIAVEWDGREVFARGQPVREEHLAWWRAEGSLPLGLGVAWRIVHAPTPQLAHAMLSASPHLLLAGGVLLSAAAGLIAHQLQLARHHARELAAANRALDTRVREASESAAVLRRLSEELERRVAARTRELEGAMSELEAFNYSVSHDLRSPLGAILNFVAILEEDHEQRLGAEGGEVLARIRGSSERALALLEGLLELSRASRAKLELEDLDMTALVHEAFLQARVARGDADVELALAPLPRARGDRALIADVLANLLDNALKYTHGRQQRRVEVSGRSEGGEVVYAVSDNGVGFDARFAGKLFGVFERLHPRDQFEGTGVGLAMVARIVHRHGGRVWAEGRPEQGACFSFSLPPAERGTA